MALVSAGQYVSYEHLLIEFAKEGLNANDVAAVVLNGTIIEEYPERHRVLIAGVLYDLPVHVVCDLESEDIVQFVTGYIPDSRE